MIPGSIPGQRSRSCARAASARAPAPWAATPRRSAPRGTAPVGAQCAGAAPVRWSSCAQLDPVFLDHPLPARGLLPLELRQLGAALRDPGDTELVESIPHLRILRGRDERGV